MSKAKLTLAIVKKFLLSEVTEDAKFQYDAVIKYDYVRKILDIIGRAENEAVFDKFMVSPDEVDYIINGGESESDCDTCGIHFENVKGVE